MSTHIVRLMDAMDSDIGNCSFMTNFMIRRRRTNEIFNSSVISSIPVTHNGEALTKPSGVII